MHPGYRWPFHVEEVRSAYERRSITFGELAECLNALENAPNVAAADSLTAARRRMCE